MENQVFSCDELRDAHALSRVRAGVDCRIVALKGDRDLCRKLREMGIRERMTIRVLVSRRNMVCLVGGTRFAINRLFADCILVIEVN